VRAHLERITDGTGVLPTYLERSTNLIIVLQAYRGRENVLPIFSTISVRFHHAVTTSTGMPLRPDHALAMTMVHL